MPNKINQAFILGAGIGTRLRPLTDSMPKVMLPIAPGKPLLEYTIELLRGQGITEFVVNLHYLPQVITSHFGDGERLGVHIDYSDESDFLLETGGAIRKAANLLHDNFLFIYGDTFHSFNFIPAIEIHAKNNALATIVLKRSKFPKDGEIGEFDPVTKKITKWHVRPHDITEPSPSQMVNSGLYVLSKKILGYIAQQGPVKLDHEVIPKAMAAHETLCAFPTDELIFDIGRPEKYELAKEYHKLKTTRK